MRSSLILFFLSATSFLFAQPSRVPEIQYQSVPDFLKLPPDLQATRLRVLAWQ